MVVKLLRGVAACVGVAVSAASLLARVSLDNHPRPLGGEGGDPAGAGEPGEGVGGKHHSQELCGTPR